MDILGYIGFAVLIYLAITWTIGVRVHLGAGVHTIFGALFFLISAVIIGVSNVNKLHSFWIIPTGFVLAMFLSLLAVYSPAIFRLFQLVASAFAIVVRIGIPQEKIREALEADARATIERFKNK